MKVDNEYEDIYDALGDRASKSKIFDNKISVFVFAAAKRTVLRDG